MCRYKNFFIALFLCSNTIFASYSEPYVTALEDLIKVHKKYFPHEPIAMNNTTLVYSVYKKIITPWALMINGQAHIVENKFYSKVNYWDDIQNLWQNFSSYQSKVKDLEKKFSDVGSSKFLPIFYQEIGADVVQIFFNLIQDSANSLTIDTQTLEACFIFYKIAFEMYESDMNLSGIQQGTDFVSTISGNMVILYQNAIKNLVNQLSIGMLGTQKIETIYDQIARYYTYLAQIGTDIKDTQLISTSQAQAQQACQNYGYYLQAQKLYQEAQTLLKKYKQSPVLSLKNSNKLVKELTVVGQNIGQVTKLVQQAEQYYQEAQDIFGQNQANFLYTIIDNINLWIVQGVAQLWLLYLEDQSSLDIATAPTIRAFISSQDSNNQNVITNQQILNTFQNLSGLIQQKTNAINALSTINVLKEYSLQEIIDSLQKQLTTILQSGADASSTSFSFVSLEAINSVQDIIFYLAHLSDSMVLLLKSNSFDDALDVMAYAQALDTVYKNLSQEIVTQVHSLVPYFPNQLLSKTKTQASWSDWVKQILVVSNIVSKTELEKVAIAKISIAKPLSQQQKPVEQSELNNLEKLASQEALDQNFSNASSKYQQLMNLYTTLYSLNAGDTKFYNAMMQTKTMYSALSFASSLESLGNITWKNITDIPEQYVATKYGFNDISVTSFGMSQLPASLIGITAGTEYTTINKQQEQDLFQLIKAYALSKLLSVQGVEFDQIFTDYNLKFNKNADAAGKALALQLKNQVDIVFNQFKGTTISSVVLSDATTIGSVMCTNIKLSKVTPLFSDMATALNFYISAQLLVGPSKTEVKLGSSSYVAVDNKDLSAMFLKKIAKVYLSAAYPLYQQAKSLMDQLAKSLENNKKISGSYPVNFADSLKKIDAYVVRVQALLYAQEQSAYVYAQQALDTNLSQDIEALFFDIYQEYVSWLRQCLTGKNPFDPTYQLVLHKINSVYVAWAALLTAQHQTLKVAAINDDIINLFTAAGKGCMKISYTQSLFPTFIQYHYATAAHYFIAVQMQYTKMKQTADEEALNDLIQDAYFKGSSQNIDIFLYVQKHGVTIQSQSSKKLEKIAFSDLIAQKIFASTAKQDAYNQVQNLLLNAGIGYMYLKHKIEKENQSSKNKTAITKEAKSPLTSNVTNYLRKQNIMKETDVIPSYYQQSVIQGIFAINMDAYSKFKNTSSDYASWLDVVYSALQALYGLSYLGATEGETGQEMENQITEFFTELEKHTSALENPSSAYVG